jgi:hypothetical protein
MRLLTGDHRPPLKAIYFCGGHPSVVGGRIMFELVLDHNEKKSYYIII